jgi:diguanylate cyclase (GGDEF)-like protein/PAS domain S-box-containing protein
VAGRANDPVFLRTLVDHTNDVLFVMDAEGILTFASRSASWVLGLDPDDYIGTSALDLVHPDDAQDAVEALGRSVAAGDGVLPIKNIRVRRGDGSWCRFEMESYSLLDDPAIEGFVVSGRDVTERYEQVERVRASEERYRSLFETSHDAIVLVDAETLRLVDVNPAAERVYGWSRAELLGMTARDLSADPDATERAIRDSGTKPSVVRRHHHRRDGSTFLAEISYGAGEVDGRRLVVGTVRDQTLRQEAEAARRRAEAQFRALVAESSDIITVLEPDGSWRSSSAGGSRVLGYPLGYNPPGGVFSMLVPDDLEAAEAAFQEVVAGTRGAEQPIVLRVRAADGTVRHLETVARNLVDDPAVRGIVLNSRDVTERIQADAALAASEHRFRLLVTSASDLITTFDADGLCTYASPAIKTLFGYEPAELLGSQARDLMHPDDIARVERVVGDQFAGTAPRAPIKYLMRHRDGSWRHVETMVTNLLDEPAVRAVVCNTRDVTALEAALDLLEYQATHDALTGLPNRRQFVDVGQRALARADRDGSPTGVLFLDLDGFKHVNDTLGHEAGDEVLKAVAARLRSTARAGDTVARLGGDEFCILCERPQHEQELRSFAERIVATIDDPPIEAAHGVPVGTSIGIVIAEADAAHTLEGLLREADVALYRAKRAGGGRIESVAASLR